MEGKKSSKLQSDKNLLKVLKKEKKEEMTFARNRKKSKTIVDKDISSSNYKYSEYLDQNIEFCDYMEDCAISINNFNKESYRHLFCIFDGHGGNVTAKLCVKKYPEIFRKCLLESPFDYEQALKKSFMLMDKEKELKIQKIIQHKNNMINFSNKLRNPKKWKEKNEYNYLLEKEKMEQKLKIFNQSLASKNEYSDRIRNKIMKKNKKSKEKKEGIIEDKNGDIKNYKDITIIKPSSGKINKRKNFVTKDDKGNIIHSVHNIKDEQNLCNKKDKIRDYLAEKRKKEKPKLNNIYANDIKNFLKKCGITENSLFMTKCKLDVLKEKKNQKNFFLKQNGGIAKNPEVGEELFNLSLNIIRGKLAIIEELEKKFDKESYGTNEEQDSEKESENETENKLEPKYKDGKESSV